MPMNKKLRISGIVLLLTLAAILIATNMLNMYLSDKMLIMLRERVKEESGGEYILNVEDVKVRLFDRSVSLSSLMVAPADAGRQTSKARYIIKANSLKLQGIGIISFLQGEKLSVTDLRFDDPHILIFQGDERFPVDTDSLLNGFSLFQMISPEWNSLSIENIDVENLRLNVYRNVRDRTLLLLSAKENNISVRKFKVDAGSDKAHHLFFADKFELVMKDFSYQLPDGMYTLTGKKLYASYIDSAITVDSFRIIPNYPKEAFGKVLGRQASWTTILAPLLSMSNVDVKLFFEQNWFAAKKLELEKCKIDVYRDNNIPLAEIVRPSFQAMIRDLPFFISIDTIEMKNASVRYEELAEGAVATSVMTMDKINGIITGVNNDTSSYTDKSAIRASADAVFMKYAMFKANYIFPLNSRNEVCSCNGFLGPMPINKLNPLLEPAKGISVISGQVDSMKFFFTSEGKMAKGKMTLAYHDLSVKALRDNRNNEVKTRIRSFIADQLIVKNSNPGPNGLREVDIVTNRNSYRYFPFFFMQSLLSGVAASVEGEKKSIFLKRTGLFGKK
jgi:hypothetical protein